MAGFPHLSVAVYGLPIERVSMAGRPHNSEWISEARRARTVLTLAKNGQREADLQALAGDADVNTLRRAVRAVDLLDRWSQLHRDASGKLALTPQTVLEVFAAWASVDEAAAWSAYEEWEKKRIPVLDLAKKLRQFRARKGARGSRGLEKDLRAKTALRLKRLVRKVVGSDLVVETIEESAKVAGENMMDFLLLANLPGDREDQSIAIVIVGPYRNPAMYGKRKLEWMQRAFSLAWLHDHVILLLEDETHVVDYGHWIREFRARIHADCGQLPNVHVAAVE